LTDRDAIAVAADPSKVDSLRAALPASFRGFDVQVRPASLGDQLAVNVPAVERNRSGGDVDQV
jgi:hypothetical protein